MRWALIAALFPGILLAQVRPLTPPVVTRPAPFLAMPGQPGFTGPPPSLVPVIPPSPLAQPVPNTTTQLPSTGPELPPVGSELTPTGPELPATGTQLLETGPELPATGTQLLETGPTPPTVETTTPLPETTPSGAQPPVSLGTTEGVAPGTIVIGNTGNVPVQVGVTPTGPAPTVPVGSVVAGEQPNAVILSTPSGEQVSVPATGVTP